VSAQQNGRLSSTPQQQVITAVDNGQPVVEILPTNPQVIYVPVYDPVWVWGPPIYYPYAHWYYPPVRSGLFFSVGIGIGGFFGHGWGGWGGWGWHPAWGSRTVIVNNTFIRENQFNVTRVANVGRSSVWSHDSFHRQGVPYPNQALNQRYAGNFRQNGFAPRAAAPVQTPVRSFAQNNRPAPMAMPNQTPRQNFNEPRQSFGAPRQNFREMPQARFENRQVTPSVPNRAGINAFQGGNSGRAQVDRSFSSPPQARSFAPMARSAMPSQHYQAGPARESHGGGQPHGGGGGGGGGGGKGHRR